MRCALLLITAWLGQEAPEPSASVPEIIGTIVLPQAELTGIHPAVVRPDPARPTRLATQRNELVALLAAMQRFGTQDAWIDACRRRYEEWDAAHPAESGAVEVGEWTLTTALLRAIALSPAQANGNPRLPKEDGLLTMLLTLVDFERQFAAQGIDFLVVVVPSKLTIHPEIVLPDWKSDGFAGMGATVVEQLLAVTDEGVEAMALHPAFVAQRNPADPAKDDLLFLKSDPHWTARGAELGAEQVARRIEQFPWFKRGALKEGRQFRVVAKEIKYTAGGELASKGSRDETMHGRAVLKGDAPFDCLEAKSPILVFGDSYARVHHEQGADFVTHLSRFLGWKIDCLFAANGGQRQVRQKLARREPGEWKGKRLAIWLLPEQLAIAPVRIDPIDLFAPAGGDAADGEGRGKSGGGKR